MVNGLVADADSIYVTDPYGRVVSVAKSGGNRVTLFVFDSVIPGPVVADNTMLYFLGFDVVTELGSVYALPKAQGSGVAPLLLASEIETPIAIAIDEQHVYWLDVGTFTGSAVKPNGKLERVTKKGTSRQTLASGLSAPLALAMDATDVYFGETGFALGNPSAGLRKIRKSGGAIAKLTDGRPVAAIDIVGEEVFYSSVGDLDGADPQLSRMATGGGTPEVLYSDALALIIRVEGETIFIMGPEDEETDFLAVLPKNGGPARTLRRSFFDAYSFALDACAVYYGTDSNLERSPR